MAAHKLRSVVTPLKIEEADLIMQETELAVGGRFVAGEAVYVRNNGIPYFFCFLGLAIGLMFDAIEAEQAEVFDGNPIYD